MNHKMQGIKLFNILNANIFKIYTINKYPVYKKHLQIKIIKNKRKNITISLLVNLHLKSIL